MRRIFKMFLEKALDEQMFVCYNKIGLHKVKPCAVKIGAVGREGVARMFVSYAVGTNADKRFSRACLREELPSFAIGLLKYTATTATGVETMKK